MESPIPIVEFYNSTKSGVDNLDKLVRGFSSKRKTRRWPCSVFFTLVDVCVVAAHKMMGEQCGDQIDHYGFKRDLSYQMCKNLIDSRQQLPHLRKTVKDAIKRCGMWNGNPVNPQEPRQQAQGRCTFCDRRSDKKSRTKCQNCNKFVCAVHQNMRCPDCAE